ncbi:MAG: alpha/beta fold hydrolase [Alphaproteobacteria bacterium]|nr:alpha/beta fold hydrolase [Alphaproteobacteria bacterium]
MNTGTQSNLDVAEAGAGRALVLLHSLLSDRDAFDRVAPKLARERRVLLVDLPGFGKSVPAGPRLEDFADRIAENFDRLGLKPAHTDVLGNGFGGFVAVALAVRHGQKFDKLVLVDTGAAIPDIGKPAFHKMAALVESGGMAAVLDAALARMFPADFIAAHPAIAEERRAALRRTDPGYFAAACRALAALDLRSALKSIHNPTLVVVGLKDTATPPALSHELAANIPGAQLVELPHCGHSPHIQDPDGFRNAVKPFLGLKG